MANYSELLKNPKWQKRRLEILSRDEFMCQSCFDTESELHVHHKCYNYGVDIWDYKDDDLITYCKSCHEECTELKKSIKKIIDKCFVDPELLNHIEVILKNLRGYNPYDLYEISKFIASKKNNV